MIHILAKNLVRTYRTGCRSMNALLDVSIELPPGSSTVVIGRSGAGKTTLLRLLAGLEAPDEGHVVYERSGQKIARKDLRMGPVFQEPRLIPWLNVERNLSFALEGRCPRRQIGKRTEELLELLDLTAFRAAMPHQLSGGMAGRVALGRALAYEPEVMLMDEPFGALDRITRIALRRRVREIQRKSGAILCLVTHDLEEALEMGDALLIMESGRIVESFFVPSKSEETSTVDLEKRLRELLPPSEERRSREESAR